MKKYRKGYLRSYRGDSDAVTANNKLRYAVITGRVIRPGKCSDCGKVCVPEGHHEDYSRPLDVVWLCKKCHGRLRRIKDESLTPDPSGK